MRELLTEKKNLIALVVLALIVVASLLLACIRPLFSGTAAEYVEISADGDVSRISLDEDHDFTITGKYGYNEVSIHDGEVRVLQADCKNHDCIRQGAISKPGEEIICLPHKLFIRIVPSNEGGADTQDSASSLDTIAR